eukprot:TRINITY_DN4180_c0_g1_i4.p3 TRINITY_DN4180_c0_g1~~TRINITY_DN4180_c0_g1_i4.p3  ORF type:complete len:134 (+),score=37.62 TRINITY_DN4180_c0_g1_i4:175-576(+)
MQTDSHVALRSKCKEFISDNILEKPLKSNSAGLDVKGNEILGKAFKKLALKNLVKSRKRKSTAVQSESGRGEMRRRGARRAKAFTRQLWKAEEDDAIASLIREHGTKKWTLVARKLQEEYKIYGRTGKQCRER